VVVKFQISDFVKTQWPPRGRLCMTLKAIFDRQFEPLQFLHAEDVRPTPRNLSPQLSVYLLVILHQSK
jgi:hypothetical protein